MMMYTNIRTAVQRQAVGAPWGTPSLAGIRFRSA
jgi:hypothetical protein